MLYKTHQSQNLLTKWNNFLIKLKMIEIIYKNYFKLQYFLKILKNKG